MGDPMSTDVRVRVRLGSLRLEYEGERAFYETHVEKMVEAAARRDLGPSREVGSNRDPGTSRGLAGTMNGASPSAAPSSTAGTASPGASHPRAGGGGASGVAANGSAAEHAGAPRFAPQSAEFGKFIRKLGPEAAEPDRQVVALAFYLWNYEKRATFGREELEGCFRALSLPAPAGVDAILHDLTERKRFLEPADGGEYRLSRKGENYVKTRLLAGA
jgi:hypothetical protein